MGLLLRARASLGMSGPMVLRRRLKGGLLRGGW